MNVEELCETDNFVASDNESLSNESPSSERLFTTENMEILNDVYMQITVEIGRTKIKISDLLDLKRGSVLTLEQMADDPLQIYANDKPIAKGMIVSTNGKYCVKII